MAKKKIILSTDADFKKYGIKREMDADFYCGNDASQVASKSLRKGVKRLHGGVTERKGKRIIKGYASTTDKDRVKDVITIQAMRKSKDDLMKQGANTVFFNHDTDIPIGRVIKTTVDKVGLFVEILISKADDVKDIWTKLKEGVLNAMSIRLSIRKMEVIKDDITGQIEEFRILSMELFEVSVVGMPMNPGATITDTIGKSFKMSKKKNGELNMSTKKSKRSKSGNRVANITSVVEELMGGDLSEFKSNMALLGVFLKNGGKSQEEVDLNAAKKLLKEKGFDITESEVELTEVEKLQAKIKELEAPKKKKKSLTKTEILEARIKELEGKSGERKGFSDEDEDDDNGGEPKKVLKSAADVATIKFVDYIMSDEGGYLYDGLTENEQAKAKSIFFELTVVDTLSDK